MAIRFTRPKAPAPVLALSLCGCQLLSGFEEPSAARPDPPEPRCGDEVVEGSEGCDDGNTADGDGCSSSCSVEEQEPSIWGPFPVAGGMSLPCVTTYSNSGRKIAVAEDGRIYVAMNCTGSAHVGVSVDGGTSYALPIALGISDVFEIAVQAGPGDTAYAAVVTGVLGDVDATTLQFVRSVDGGATWSAPAMLSDGFYAGTGSGVSMTAAGDDVWVAINGSALAAEGGVRIYHDTQRGEGSFARTDVMMDSTFFEVIRDPTTGDILALGQDANVSSRRSLDGGATFGPPISAFPARVIPYSDWAAGGEHLFLVGNSPDVAFVSPIAAPMDLTLVGDLQPAYVIPDPFEARTRAVTADPAGNAYVVTRTPEGPIRLYRLAAGTSTFVHRFFGDVPGDYPAVTALPGSDGVVVAYTSDGVVFTVVVRD